MMKNSLKCKMLFGLKRSFLAILRTKQQTSISYLSFPFVIVISNGLVSYVKFRKFECCGWTKGKGYATVKFTRHFKMIALC